jgi:hypothetical protein
MRPGCVRTAHCRSASCNARYRVRARASHAWVSCPPSAMPVRRACLVNCLQRGGSIAPSVIGRFSRSSSIVVRLSPVQTLCRDTRARATHWCRRHSVTHPVVTDQRWCFRFRAASRLLNRAWRSFPFTCTHAADNRSVWSLRSITPHPSKACSADGDLARERRSVPCRKVRGDVVAVPADRRRARRRATRVIGPSTRQPPTPSRNGAAGT